MFYSIKRIFHNIKIHSGVYLILILEFALGLGIFLGCYNIIHAASEDLEKAKKKTESSEVTLTMEGIFESQGDFEPQGPGISYEKYLDLKEKYQGKLELRYAPYVYVNLIAGDGEQRETAGFYLFFTNDEMFEMIFHTKMSGDTVYFGKNAKKTMKGMMSRHDANRTWQELNPFSADYNGLITFQNGTLKLFEEEIQMEAVPSTEQIRIIQERPSGDDDIFEIADLAFVSLEHYPKMDQMFQEYSNKYYYDLPPEERVYLIWPINLYISASYPDGGYDINTLPAFLAELNSPDSNTIFEANQDALEKQNNLQYLKGFLSNYQKTSVGLLAVVVLGNIGIMLILMNRRKKSIAISCAYGATRGRIALEIFAELLTVALIGMAVALIGLHYAEPLLPKIYLNTKTDITAGIVTGLVLSLVTALIPTVAAVHKLRKIEISSTLKSL